MNRPATAFFLAAAAAAALFPAAADPAAESAEAPAAAEESAAAAGDAEETAEERPNGRELAMQAGQEMHGVRLPLRRHPGNGRVKELLAADRATVDEKGIVHVDGRIQLLDFDENGATNSFAVALAGFYDPVREYAECHGPVAYVRPGLVLAGTNLAWNAKTCVLRIETNAIVRFQREGRSVVDALGRK
ncbi:MAG: hypothetical protein IJV65_00525 [Kiritimatiellae bacterium]|nr:hypothetical protein [Kiritimatiellia bacterium]